MMLEHLRRMARYNRWANQRPYAACRALPEAEYRKPRQACWLHLFNHQTNHRRQALDLIYHLRESPQAP
jgi:uncharacterized damage-inducible protein DinB